MRLRYLALAGAVCTVVSLSFVGLLPAYQCNFAKFLGVACPMCGTTRAWQRVFAGDIAGSFLSNPLFLLWTLWCLVALVDLVHKGLGATHSTIGERCVLAATSSGVLRAAHVALVMAMLVYVNVFGPTASEHFWARRLFTFHP